MVAHFCDYDEGEKMNNLIFLSENRGGSRCKECDLAGKLAKFSAKTKMANLQCPLPHPRQCPYIWGKNIYIPYSLCSVKI